jgi:hypothetical protein
MTSTVQVQISVPLGNWQIMSVWAWTRHDELGILE